MRWLALAALLATGCGGADAPEARTGPPVLRVTTYPLAWMAEQLVGDAARVELVTPPTADAATWVPDTAALLALQQADLVVLNGAGFEGFTTWASLPPSRTVETAASFRHRWLRYADAVAHTHGPDDHVHQGLDGHTWLDPVNAIDQAEALHAALVRTQPALQARADAGLARLRADLDALHVGFQAVFAAHPRLVVVTSHPAWAYPARRYGFATIERVLDPEQQPSPAVLASTCQAARAQGAKLLLWEAPPRPPVAATFEARCGLQSFVWSPVEQPPAGGDYLAVSRATLAALAQALGPPP
ncbi:MAG: zinc ABC transporter substrate-binding protein [Myxococcales bacterium]|nr:zinc ABC transporter substrate-binding protein [Myxococcales bacterium]